MSLISTIRNWMRPVNYQIYFDLPDAINRIQGQSPA